MIRFSSEINFGNSWCLRIFVQLVITFLLKYLRGDFISYCFILFYFILLFIMEDHSCLEVKMMYEAMDRNHMYDIKQSDLYFRYIRYLRKNCYPT